MDNELKNAVKSEKKDKLANNPAQNTTKKPSKNPKGANDDFKRRYFEYYDDIKISDRQDW